MSEQIEKLNRQIKSQEKHIDQLKSKVAHAQVATWKDRRARSRA